MSLTFVPANAATNVSGNITQNTTWTMAESPYVVTGSVTVYNPTSGGPAVTLTIEPGVEVRFASLTQLQIGYGGNANYKGALFAQGTAELPITFTSNAATPAPGDWRRIYFDDGTDDAATILEHCIVEYGGNTYNANIHLYNASPTIKNSTIRNSSQHGIYLQVSSNPVIGGEGAGNVFSNNVAYGIFSADTNSNPTVLNNIFSNNGNYPLRIRAQVGNVGGNTYTGNAKQAIEVLGMSIAANTTWKNPGVPYVVTGNVTVYNPTSGGPAVTLTIEPGVEAQFGTITTLQIGYGNNPDYRGALFAQGTAELPIMFTSSAATPTPGSWRAIYFDNGTDDAATILEHCIVEYGGSAYNANLYINSASPTIKNCTIRNSSQHGIYLTGSSNPVIDGEGAGNVISNNGAYGIFSVDTSSNPTVVNNTFTNNGNYPLRIRAQMGNVGGNTYTGNAKQAIEVLGMSIAANTSWKNPGVPYVVTGNVTVYNPTSGGPTVTLTIEPGVEVRFASSTQLQIGYGGSPNFKGALFAQGTAGLPITFTSNAATPAPGDWRRIYFDDGTDDAATILEHCIMEYGGNTYNANIYLYNASPTIQYSTIRNSSYSGIYVTGSGSNNAQLKCNNLKDNLYGIYLTSGTHPLIENNNFLRNQNYGLYNSSGASITAQNNWWGDANGPNQSGDRIYGTVNYTPWLTAESSCIGAPPTNSPPYAPRTPTPIDGAVRVAIASGPVAMSWLGGDPNPWDTIVYDVYFGTSVENLVKEADSLTATAWSRDGLAEGTTYYWQVKSRDNNSAETAGPVWRFTTVGNPPDLTVSSVTWLPSENIAAGQNVTFTATIQNSGVGPVVDAFQVNFKIDGTGIGIASVSPVIPVGGSVQVSRTWTAQTGNHTIEVIADSTGTVAESDEANNSLSQNLPAIVDTTPPQLSGATPANGSFLKQANQIVVTLSDTFGGTVDDAAVITSFTVRTSGGQTVAGTVNESSDRFTFTPTSQLTDDTYHVSLTARDAAGNTRDYSFSFTIDNVAPPAPQIDPVASPTYNPHPVITGTKEAYAAILLNHQQVVGNTAETTWQYTASLASGQNQLSFAAKDRAGNQGDATVVQIFFDDIPPQAVDTLTANGQGSGTTITLNWTGYNESLHGDIASYRVYAETASFTSVSGLTARATVPAHNFTYILANLTQGVTYYLAVVAVDAGGNALTTVSPITGATADIQAPENVTNLRVQSFDNRLVFTWNHSADSAGDLSGYKVYFNNAPEGVSLPSTQNSYEKTGLNPATGYPCRITAYDGTGNESVGTSITGVTLLPNPTGLTVTPQSGYANLSWSGVQPSQYVKYYAVYASETDFTSVNGMSPRLNATGTSARVAGLTNNVRYYFAVTTVNTSDGEGKTVTTVSGMPVPDTTGPNVTNTKIGGAALVDGYTVHKSALFTLDAADPAGISRVEFYIDGTLVRTVYSGAYEYYWNIAAFSDGNHTLKIEAYDTYGNKTTSQYTLVTALDPPVAPTITQPASGLVTNKSTVAVSGYAEKDTEVLFMRNGSQVGNTVPVDALGNFTTTLSLASGENNIQAQARNRAGTSAPSVQVLVTVDNTIPSSPATVTVQAAAGGQVKIAWKAPSGAAMKGYNVYRASTSFTEIGPAEKANSNLITATAYSDLPAEDGTYYYRVTSVSAADNESELSSEVSAMSDRVAPKALSIVYTPRGNYDPQTGRMAPGRVDLVLAVSEPLQTAPFLSITPEGGLPVSAELTQVSNLEYSGFFFIANTTPSGMAHAVFSARDMVGNRGTEITSGGTIQIDTAGPAVSRLVILPANPIKNVQGNPVSVTVTVGLNERIKNGLAPEFSYLLSGSGRQAAAVSLSRVTTQGGDIETWQGAFSLPADGGLSGPETFRFTWHGSDDLDNAGETVLCNNLFQVYQGNLPPLATPGGFKGGPMAGGRIKLNWNGIESAAGYQLCRKAPGESELSAYQRLGTVLEYTDQPATEGVYTYAIASIRQENSQETLSGMGAPIDVSSDTTAPGAPVNLTLQLLPQGIKALWEAPSSQDTLTYRLYRSSSAITSIQGLTPVAANITGINAVDSSPSPTDHYYVVTAADQAGNESAPSNCFYLNFGLLPVSVFNIRQSGNDAPVITWTHPGGGISGYNLYLAGTKLNQEPLTETTYTDNGYAGDERAYSVKPVDNNAQEGPGRSLTLPVLQAALKEGTTIRRGVMNRIEYAVENRSAAAVNNVRLKVMVDGHPHASESFSVSANSTVMVPVTVGGYADLGGTAALETTIEIITNAGEKVEIVRASTVEVGTGMLVLQILNDTFTRGGSGSVRFTLQNTGDEEIEITTAKSSGSAPSDEITFYLLDKDENVVASTKFKQALGSVITLPGGNSVARIAAGASFASDLASIAVPANAPQNVTVRLQIAKIYFHQGRTDQVIMDGLSGNRDVILIDTAYSGEIISISPQSAAAGQDIVICGRAVEKATGGAMPSVPLKLVLTVNGFERSYSIITADNGQFSFTFRHQSTESGLYTVRVVHPDILDKPVQGQFTVNGVTVTPTAINLGIPRNYEQTVTLTAKAGEGTNVTNLRLTFEAADQPGGALPAGVHVTPGAPVASLEAGKSATLVFTIWADNTAASGPVILKARSDENGGSPWATVAINAGFSAAQPVLYFTPNHVETGVAFNETVTEQITLQNKGLADLQGVAVSLVNADGSPAPNWVVLNTPAGVGSIPVGQSRELSLTASPKPEAGEGVRSLKVRVTSANYPTTDINVYVSVTQSGTGGALFKVSDIYTGTIRQGTGDIIQGLQGASLYVQNENVLSVERNATTDIAGEALFGDLPAGRYKYRLTAPGHRESIGRFQVRPGVTSNESVFLEYNLVTVEWEVTETTIRDQYEVVLRATYETDVPAAVVVAEPLSVTLPAMKSGDVYNGEFTLTNHGLIRADNVAFTLPQNDKYFRYELLQALPESIGAKEHVTVAYRLTSLESLDQSGSGTSGGGGPVGSYSAKITAGYSYVSANGCGATGSASHYLTSAGTSSGGASGGIPITYGGGWGAWSESGSFTAQPLGGAKCLPKADRKEVSTCASDPEYTAGKCPKPTDGDKCQAARSSVNTLYREYNRDDVDLKIKVPGGTIAVQRLYYGDKWAWNHLNKLIFNLDTLGSLQSIDKGGVLYKEKPLGSGVFRSDTYTIAAKDTGRRWEDTRGNWREYDSSGRMTAYGTRAGTLGKLLYEPGTNGRLTGVADRNDRQVFWYEYNAENLISAVRDLDNRRVEYTYTGGLLTGIRDVLGNSITHAYDSGGRITRNVDAAGRESTVTYDGYGNISSVRDSRSKGSTYEFDYDESKKEYYARITSPLGTVKEIWYDRSGDTKRIDMNGRTVKSIAKDGRIQTTTDERGYTTRREYDEWDNLLKIIWPDGTSASYEYEHKFNRRTKETDERGIVTVYEYDTQGNLTRKTDAQGMGSQRITHFTYDTDGNLLSATTAGDAQTQSSTLAMTYDAYENVLTSTDGESKTTTFTYDTLGNVLTKVDPRGKTWGYSYNTKGWLLTATDPLNHVTSFTYDNVGNRTREVDPGSKEKNYTYNQDNRIVTATDALGNAISYEYNDDGRLSKQTDAEGKEVRYTYDQDGRLAKTIDGNGNMITNVYDATGSSCPGCIMTTTQPSKTIFPTFTREYQYDRRSRKITERDVLSTEESGFTQFSYDAIGNLTAKTDKEGKVTAYEYNELNRLRRVVDPLNQPTSYTYDSRDNLLSLTDAKGQTTAFSYDKNNRLTKETRPLGQETTYQYDNNGNLVRKTDAKGQKIEYGYDDAGRLTEIRHYDTGGGITKTVVFTYDNAGNLKTWNDGAASGTYDYDDAYHKTQEVTNYGSFNLTTGYTYHRNGLKKSFTYPNNTTVEYSYDGNNQPADIQIPHVGFITYNQYQWTRPVAVTLPGGGAKQFTYDALMRSKTITSADPGQNTQMNYSYTYDRMDNITQRNTEAGNYAYTYDNLYRLLGVNKDSQGSEAYTYDPVGNRLTSSATTGSWSYNQNNELQSYDGATFQYDANGNTTQKNVGGQIQNFVYDVDNRLIEVRDGSNTLIASYTYDPFGRRIKKDAGGMMIWYLYSDQVLIGEYDSAGVEIKTYGYKPSSTWTTDPVFMQQGSQYYFYHNDHLGTPQKMTNMSGAVVWSADYDAFGKAAVDAGSTITSNLRFPGQYYDPETGLHYNYNRYYDSSAGNFMTADPIGFDGDDIHLYRYVWNNPIKWFDRFGLAGDGQKANQEYINDPMNWAFGYVDENKIVSKGHSDLYESDRFDWTKEDKDSTAPIPIIGDPERHFREENESLNDVKIAVIECNYDDFRRAMHRLQDYYFHRKKGYQWKPWRIWDSKSYGHAFALDNPDADDKAWECANSMTMKMVKEWDANPCCADK